MKQKKGKKSKSRDAKKLLSIAAGSLVLCGGALQAEEVSTVGEVYRCIALGSGAEVRDDLAEINQAVDAEDYLAFWWLWDDEIETGASDASKTDEAKCGEGKCGGDTMQSEPVDVIKTDEAKCGEGKCGADKATEVAKNWWEQ